MRAPGSFRGELAAYRQRLLTGDRRRDSHWKCRLATEVLDRWGADEDADKVWDEIKTKLPPDDPSMAGQFIATVLFHRIKAEELRQIVKELPAVDAKTRRRSRHFLKQKQDDQMLVEMALLREVHHGRATLLRRQIATAPRIYFSAFLSDTFDALFGQPFDEIVKYLTEVAFNTETSIDAIRGARKSSTRQARRARGRK
jgi:hypothetical protein